MTRRDPIALEQRKVIALERIGDALTTIGEEMAAKRPQMFNGQAPPAPAPLVQEKRPAPAPEPEEPSDEVEPMNDED